MSLTLVGTLCLFPLLAFVMIALFQSLGQRGDVEWSAGLIG
jgi:hypothetical protein